jgi:hypothetical protein
MGKSKPSPAVAYNSSRRCCFHDFQLEQGYTPQTEFCHVILYHRRGLCYIESDSAKRGIFHRLCTSVERTEWTVPS